MKQRLLLSRFTALLLVILVGSIGVHAQFDPPDPPEPAVKHKVTVSVSPKNAGNVSGSGTYKKGDVVYIHTSGINGFKFQYWTKNGLHYSDNTSFQYTVEGENADFVAVYEYDPANPADPEVHYDYTNRLYLECTPAGACSFNRTSGDLVERDTWVSVAAYPSQGFVFHGWYDNGEKVSSNISFQYQMKDRECHLVARFEFDPPNPEDPPSVATDVDNQVHSGDVNNDGVTDVSDVVVLVNCYLAGTLDTLDPIVADVNADGVVDISDVVAIINKYLSNH